MGPTATLTLETSHDDGVDGAEEGWNLRDNGQERNLEISLTGTKRHSKKTNYPKAADHWS